MIRRYRIVRTRSYSLLMSRLAHHLWLKHHSFAAFEIFTAKPITFTAKPITGAC